MLGLANVLKALILGVRHRGNLSVVQADTYDV